MLAPLLLFYAIPMLHFTQYTTAQAKRDSQGQPGDAEPGENLLISPI